MSADQGLLVTLVELAREAASRAVSAEEIAAAAGVPPEYTEFVERLLERDAELGLVARGPDGRWRVTPLGEAHVRAD